MDYFNPLIHQSLIHLSTLGLKCCFWGQFVANGHAADSVMIELVRYSRKSETLPEEVVKTFLTIVEVSGKSIPTLFRTISLLKLPPEIQTAIVPPLSGLNRTEGTLQVSQGCIFAANLDCPDLRGSE